VRSFFAGRPSERAIWEAKRHAEKARLAKFVREESCGFANRRGGYLILGAEEGPDGAWNLNGVEVPRVREMHGWVSSLMAALDPVPDFDVQECRLRNKRARAVRHSRGRRLSSPGAATRGGVCGATHGEGENGPEDAQFGGILRDELENGAEHPAPLVL
jgi:hypothetical protein